MNALNNAPNPGTSPPWSIAAKSIVAVASLALLILVIWRFQNLITPLVIAAILAYLLSPAIDWLQRQLGGRRGLAVAIVFLALSLALGGVSTALGFVAVDQINKLLDFLPNSLTDAIDLVQGQIDATVHTPYTIAGYTLDLSSFRVDFSTVARQAVSWIQPVFSSGGSLAAQVASTTVNTVSNLFLIFVVAIYFAKDSRQFAGQIIDLAGNAGYAADADRLIRDFTRIWNAYLRGQVILGLVMGVVVGFSLVVLGVNNALGLGILAGVLEFLPVVGPLLSSLAAILVAFFQPDNWLGMSSFNYALTVAIVMILLQQLENNMLVPRIVGGALDLHPLLVMISVIMGASLAGILGAVLAAPVVASLKLFGGYIWRKLLDLPPFPQPEAEDRPPTQRLRLVAAWWLRVRRRATKVLQGR